MLFFMSVTHLVSSSLSCWSEYVTDLFGALTVASFSLAFGERDRRNSMMMRACTRMLRRKDRSLIYTASERMRCA
jgi:hypothetical protein